MKIEMNVETLKIQSIIYNENKNTSATIIWSHTWILFSSMNNKSLSIILQKDHFHLN